MAMHFNIVTTQFLNELNDYNESVERISHGVVHFLHQIKKLSFSTERMTKYNSVAIEICNDIKVSKEILHFVNPIKCCDRILTSTETLLLHYEHGDDEVHFNTNANDDLREQIIFFNFYCQFFAIVLRNFNFFHQSIDTQTIGKLRKINTLIDAVLKKKPFNKSKNYFHQAYFKKWKLVFDYDCKICKGKLVEDTILFIKINPRNVFVNDLRHVKSKEHNENLKLHNIQKDTSNDKVVTFLQGVTMKDIDEIANIGKELQYCPEYDDLMEDLKKKMRFQYPLSKFYYFGSRYTGLSTTDGDLDVFMETEREPVAVLESVVETLKKYPDEWDNLRPNPHAKIPVLKAHSLTFGINCDLSFSNKLAVYNSRLVKYFFELQPICHKLIIFVKRWNRKSDLNIHSMVVVILAVFYMQIKKLLPSVEELQSFTDEVMECFVEDNAWNVNFTEDLTLKDLKMSKSGDLTGLIIGFFNYYSTEFDFENEIIAPYSGKPEEKSEYDKIMQVDKPMIVQDFFQHDRNVSIGVSKRKLQNFVNYCKVSAKVMGNKNSL